MDPDVARVESAIDRAARRGDFDDLPGAAKPLHLPATHDPDWWVNQRIASGEIDRQELLPVVVLLRKEFEARDATLAELPSARAARDYAEDFTERVHEDRRRNPFQRMLAPAWDPDDAAVQWRALRATAPTETPPSPLTEGASAPAAGGAPAPRRRWWRFGRRS